MEVMWYPSGPYLLTWINFNPCMDKQLHLLSNMAEITYAFPNCHGTPLKFGEW